MIFCRQKPWTSIILSWCLCWSCSEKPFPYFSGSRFPSIFWFLLFEGVLFGTFFSLLRCNSARSFFWKGFSLFSRLVFSCTTPDYLSHFSSTAPPLSTSLLLRSFYTDSNSPGSLHFPSPSAKMTSPSNVSFIKLSLSIIKIKKSFRTGAK